jgi:molybdenum cofactor cytidylyltransferase
MISAILLAAGESRRMGEFKQLLSFRGKTFVAACVDNLLESGIDEVIVVTGHRADEVREALSGRKIRFTHNEEYRLGMSSSIKRGLRAASADARACLIALVDQPQIPASVFRQVIEAYRHQTPLVAIASSLGRRGHPILIDMRLRNEVLGMDDGVGLKQVIRAHQEHLVLIEVGTESILVDCDVPEDYQRINETAPATTE